VTFEEARAQFPVLARTAYLNAGTFGPLPAAVDDAMRAQQRRDVEEGRAGMPYFEAMLAVRERVRTKLAGLLGVVPEQVALTRSTTDGCNAVLAGLRLGPDDEVVTTDHEHFGLLGALAVSGARVVTAPVRDRPAEEALELLLAAVTPRTRLIAAQHVSWTTGHVLPLVELRERTGLPVLADGAQSAGAIPVDAAAFDFYTVSAQKWLCGPDGTGALVVARPDELPVAVPSHFSQAAFEPGGSFTSKDGAARFDFLVPTPALAGLEAALDARPDWAFARAAEQAARCRERLAEHVEVVTEPGHATLVSFRAQGDAAETSKRLFEAGVLVRDLPGTGLVRASPGWWTNDDDQERLVAVMSVPTRPHTRRARARDAAAAGQRPSPGG
jgi:L-cysteine/cystine lyase